jgi:flagellar biosynthesis GTPase FlhF
MGGLLAADIALLFRHRIIGIINFDVPFVGMHPGIIKAGLGSIFKSTPPPKDQILQTSPEGAKPSRMSTIFNPKPSDPNYNPSFSNDVHLPVRKGLDNALHWFNKHSNDIREAGKGLIKSHFEFGSAMADYKELKDRYARVRALEEDDQSKRQQGNPGVRSPPRIRFVNYYTATTGRMKEPKKPKAPKSPSPPRSGSVSLQHRDSDASGVSTSSQQRSGQTNLASGSQPSSSLDVNDHQGKRIVPVPPQQVLSAAGPQKSFSDSDDALDSERPVLPEIPPIPQEPPFVDLMQYTDRAQRRAAAREHEEALEEYQKAVKARNKAIDEREDLEEEWETQRQHRAAAKPKKVELTGEELRLEQEKERMAREQARLEGKEYQPSSSRNVNDSQKTPGLDDGLHTMSLGEQPSRSPYANYDFSRSAILSQPDPDDQASVTDSNYTATTNDTDTSPTDSDKKPQKQKKLGKFCVLPPKDAAGHKDPTWVRVHMDGMDEVAAHTSLFFVNETYERLVGDVGARIEDWVREADSERVVREMSGMA